MNVIVDFNGNRVIPERHLPTLAAHISKIACKDHMQSPEIVNLEDLVIKCCCNAFSKICEHIMLHKITNLIAEDMANGLATDPGEE